MSRQVSQTWRRAMTEGSPSEWLRLDVELVLDEGGMLSTWSLMARLEPASGTPLLLEGLPGRGAVSIQHTFRNHVRLAGELDVVITDDSIIIWARQLQYGFDQLPPHYFEGSIADVFGGALPPDPPAPPDPPDPDRGDDQDPPGPLPPDEPEPEPPIVAPADEDGDLFPYTYMRQWPEPARADLELRFFALPYPLDAAPTGQLLQQLAALRAGGGDARFAMQALTARYLAGSLGDDAPFLDEVSELAGPISAYPEIYALLAASASPSASPSLTPDAVVAQIWKLLGLAGVAEVAQYLQSAAHLADLARIWQSYLALVVELGFDRRGRNRLVQALVVEHALGWLVAHPTPPRPAQLAALAAATAVLPASIFPLPPAQSSPPLASPPEDESAGSAADADSAIVPYAIGELLMVKHRRRGYALGELAYVESIRAGERRESKRRQRHRSVEDSVETRDEASSQVGDERVTTSTLSSETLGALADTTVTTTYDNFGTSYGPPTTATLTGGWTVEQKPSGTPSKQDLTRFARDVLSKTVDRIAHRVAWVRSRRSSRDAEEMVRSVVDNSQGKANRRAVYRWLDEVYGARVVNYGHRLLVELILRAPAAHLLHQAQAPWQRDLEPPLPPAALGIESYEDIQRGNFSAIVARYPGESFELPPPRRRVVSASLRSGEARAVELPEGYQATSATLGYALTPGAGEVTIEGVVGLHPFQLAATTAGTQRFTLDGEDGAVQVVVEASAPQASPPELAAPPDGPLFSFELEAEPGERAMDAWRLRTFQAMQRAYAAQRQAHARGTGPEPLRPEAVRPRLSARAVERRELKHGALELLFARLESLAGGAERPVPGQPLPELALARPRYLGFFDAAFEWREMTYSFLGGRSEHAADPAVAAACARFGDDERFREFLEAPYARLLVPVAIGQAAALLYFLASGSLWELPDRHVAVHPSNLALANELAGVALERGREGETPRLVRELPALRVPTSIAVLTDGDVPLLADTSLLADASLLAEAPLLAEGSSS